jgi:hypothetical protein
VECQVADLSRVAVEAGLPVFLAGRVLRQAGVRLWGGLVVGFQAVNLSRVAAGEGLRPAGVQILVVGFQAVDLSWVVAEAGLLVFLVGRALRQEGVEFQDLIQGVAEAGLPALWEKEVVVHPWEILAAWSRAMNLNRALAAVAGPWAFWGAMVPHQEAILNRAAVEEGIVLTFLGGTAPNLARVHPWKISQAVDLIPAVMAEAKEILAVALKPVAVAEASLRSCWGEKIPVVGLYRAAGFLALLGKILHQVRVHL